MVSPPDVGAAKSPPEIARLARALPFALSLLTVPLAMIGAAYGGWTVLLLPLFAWGLFDVLDLVMGQDTRNENPATGEKDLFWYRFVTMIWAPIQFCLVFGLIHYVTRASHLGVAEKIGLFFGLGVVTGIVGIVHAHELLHQKDRLERWLGDLLLAMVLYSHFRSEHLRVHHVHVGTPRDAVTARFNENFHRYLKRVLLECPRSAWRAEVAMLFRAGRKPWSASNPFWGYAALQLAMIGLAIWRGAGGAAVLPAGLRCDLAARADQLRRALRADPPPSWRRKV